MTHEQHKSDPGIKASRDESRQRSDSKTVILVVDDDVRILNFVRVSLRLAGYDVITATSGEEALKMIDLSKPDIMLLDILMSPMDGFEVLQKLRIASKLPIIAVSAHSSAAGKALSLGANDFLSKPFKPDELQKRIRSLLNHKG